MSGWLKCIVLAAGTALAATSANAAPITFDLEWALAGQTMEGPVNQIVPVGPDATGTLVIDDGLLASALDFFAVPPGVIPIISFELNILNGSFAPDTFTTNDLFYSFTTFGPINPDLDLLSQRNFGDFNVFDPLGGIGADALGDAPGPQSTDTGIFPNGVEQNTFEFGGDVFQMTSFAVSEVPLPAPMLMLLASLAGLAAFRRRAA